MLCRGRGGRGGAASGPILINSDRFMGRFVRKRNYWPLIAGVSFIACTKLLYILSAGNALRASIAVVTRGYSCKQCAMACSKTCSSGLGQE